MTKEGFPAPGRSASRAVALHDGEAVLRLIEAASGVHRRYQFFVWLQTCVHPLLPHSLVICGAYQRQIRQLSFEVFNSVVIDRALQTALSGADSAAMSQIVRWWVGRGGVPTVIGVEDLQPPANGQGEIWLRLREVGGSHLLVHGVSRPERLEEVESLFAFAQTSAQVAPSTTYHLELLLPVVHAVYQRMLACERDLAPQTPLARREASRPPAQRPRLTAREREILIGLRRGQSNRQIAEDLGISALTVKNHLQRLLRKLGASNRTHAVSVALDSGLLPNSRFGELS